MLHNANRDTCFTIMHKSPSHFLIELCIQKSICGSIFGDVLTNYEPHTILMGYGQGIFFVNHIIVMM